MPQKYQTGHAIQGSNTKPTNTFTIKKNWQKPDRWFTIQIATFTIKYECAECAEGCSKHLKTTIRQSIQSHWKKNGTWHSQDPSMAIFSLPASERVMPERNAGHWTKPAGSMNLRSVKGSWWFCGFWSTAWIHVISLGTVGHMSCKTARLTCSVGAKQIVEYSTISTPVSMFSMYLSIISGAWPMLLWTRHLGWCGN